MHFSYALRRFTLAALGWISTCILLASVLNTMLESTAAGQISETAIGIMTGMKPSEFKGRSPTEVRKDIEAALRQSLGLDRPAIERVAKRAISMTVLDFEGELWSKGDFKLPERLKIRHMIAEALRPTLILFGFSSLLAIAAGLPLGLAAARKPGSFLDRAIGVLAALIYGVPAWWIGGFIVYYFGIELRILPFGALNSAPPPQGAFLRFLDSASYLVMPVISIAMVRTWGIAYLARSIMVTVMGEDFIMAARARGLPERKVVGRHALGTASPGILTNVSLILVQALAGDALVEITFARPGIGRLIWTALRQNDLPLVSGGLAMFSLILIVAMAVIDIIYGLVDPRIGSSRKAARTK